MITPNEFPSIFDCMAKIAPQMDFLDQLEFTKRMTQLAMWCDETMRKYDGRDERMNAVIEALNKEVENG